MLLQAIADYAVKEQSNPLRAEVIHQAKRAVIDWFAALLPGGVLPPATLLRAALAEDVGRGRARLYPDGERSTLRTAALINGTASHIVEFDDIFRDAIYHPGGPIIAASLAAAQVHEVGGLALVRGVIVGYEVSTRIGVVMNPAHYRYWHTTGTIGTLGAAAAVATVLELDRDRVAHAIATAATFAAGLQQAFRSDAMSKPLHAGHAAEAGALAALAAAQGVTGALDILEGERGFGAAMSEGCDWTRALEGLGEQYNITRMTVKNHGCCGHTFAAIDGILALREQHRLTAERVRRIRVGTYRTAVEVTGSYRADTPFEGKFSLPYVVCSALVHGSVRLDAFSPQRLADPRVRELMTCLELEVDPESNARFPQQRAAMITVETVDGRVLEHFQPTRKGDPDQPLTDAELTAKYVELVSPVIGEDRADALLRSLWSLEEVSSTDLTMGPPLSPTLVGVVTA